VLPWVRVPHLASHILGRIAKRISSDWMARYGHPIYLLETFVEGDCFQGICYQAANWICVGQTRGRSRNGYPGLKVPIKDIYLYPLAKRFRTASASGQTNRKETGGGWLMECRQGNDCPYVNGGDIRRLIAERDYLSQRVDEMEGLLAAAEAEIEKVRQENHQLKEENKSLGHQLKQVLGKIFKPRVKPHHDGDQPKRGAPAGHRGNSRRRPEVISEFIDIYPDKCDHCGGEVRGYLNHFDVTLTHESRVRENLTHGSMRGSWQNR